MTLPGCSLSEAECFGKPFYRDSSRSGGGGRGEGCHRTLALMGVVVLRGGPGAVIVEGSTVATVGASSVVLAFTAPVHLRQRAVILCELRALLLQTPSSQTPHKAPPPPSSCRTWGNSLHSRGHHPTAVGKMGIAPPVTCSIVPRLFSTSRGSPWHAGLSKQYSGRRGHCRSSFPAPAFLSLHRSCWASGSCGA